MDRGEVLKIICAVDGAISALNVLRLQRGDLGEMEDNVVRDLNRANIRLQELYLMLLDGVVKVI